ncbi:MAG: alpha-1,2-fucosyltransferase [Anaerolineae bacterium]
MFEPDFLNTPKDVYLQGYFQNERYFKSIESLIRQDFVVPTPFDSRNGEMAERIRRVQSVSLHIRRGDYATNAETRSIHGLLPLDYYQTAVQHIAKSVDQPHFFVFSDDPVWACDHLRLDFPLTVVDYNGAERDFEDMRLLSLCQHHIIANSSFSWWGAWLCENPDKIVCAPKRWLQDTRYDTDEVVPATWRRIGA